MMAQIREESRVRKAKEKIIVLIKMRKGTNLDENENNADDWIRTCVLIKQIHIDNPDDIIEKLYRRGNRARGTRKLVFEVYNPENRKFVPKHSKFLKDNFLRNEELEDSDGRYKYGKTESGIEFFWEVRSGKLHRI